MFDELEAYKVLFVLVAANEVNIALVAIGLIATSLYVICTTKFEIPSQIKGVSRVNILIELSFNVSFPAFFTNVNLLLGTNLSSPNSSNIVSPMCIVKLFLGRVPPTGPDLNPKAFIIPEVKPSACNSLAIYMYCTLFASY